MKQGSGLPDWMRRAIVAGLLVLLSVFSDGHNSQARRGHRPRAIRQRPRFTNFNSRSTNCARRWQKCVLKLNSTGRRMRNCDISCRLRAVHPRPQPGHPRGTRTHWRRRLMPISRTRNPTFRRQTSRRRWKSGSRHSKSRPNW